MDRIYDGAVSSETGTHYMDFDWGEFVNNLFSQPPQDPFTFSMEFLDNIDERQLSELLGSMLITGAKNKYHKQIAELSPPEIEQLQRYYHSIGYEVKYQINTKLQFVPALNKQAPVNFFQIDFQPYPRIYNRYNQPDKIFKI